MNGLHKYSLTVKWTGNKNQCTLDYYSYDRSHTVSIKNKPDIFCSSDPAFLGDNSKHNPEELFIASISTCHMLWYLHLCSDAKIIVIDYSDNAEGVMQETKDGGGHFVEVVLNPIVILTDDYMIEKANELHKIASKRCFIKNSINFPVHYRPTTKTK